MVSSPNKTNGGRWLVFDALSLAAGIAYKYLSPSQPATVQAAARVFQTTPSTALVPMGALAKLPTSAAHYATVAKGVVQRAAQLGPKALLRLGAPAAIPLLGAPAASTSAGAAGAATGAAASEGIFAGASGALKYAWTFLPSTSTMVGGLGAVAFVYLAYKYWQSSAVNINTNINKQTVHVNVMGMGPGTRIVQTKDADGTVYVTIQKTPKFAYVAKRALAQSRAASAA